MSISIKKLYNIIDRQISSKYNIISLLDDNHLPIKGLPGSLKTLFLFRLFKKINRPLLLVFPDREEAEIVVDEIFGLVGEEKVSFFPGYDLDEKEIPILNPRKSGQQMHLIRELLAGVIQIVCVTVDGILMKLPDPDRLKASLIVLKSGQRIELSSLIEKLVNFGYTRESMVERPGEISLRGGILDIFPYTGEDPHRFEFFGNTIDSVRTFNVDTQRSKAKGYSLCLVPAFQNWEERNFSLFSYFLQSPVVFLEDPDRFFGSLEREKERINFDGLDSEDLMKQFEKSNSIYYYSLSSPKNVIDFGGRVLPSLGKIPKHIRDSMVSLSHTCSEIIVFCERKEQKDRIQDFLNLENDSADKILIEPGPVKRGFVFADLAMAVLSDSDILGRRYFRKRRDRFKLGVPIRELSSLQRGDYVVHIDYGIGAYLGLETIRVQGVERECLAIQYRDDDKLYVPVDKMERVQKYSGREAITPMLCKLGGEKWERIKAKTKKSIKNIAKDLIALYSQRKMLPGYQFSLDTTWMKELEDTFEFNETDDQKKALQDVKCDMEEPIPMERLVCGDVGYGKTEVAIRAAFKAVVDGKQVAMLVPTTVLAQQHFRTFHRRFFQFPIALEMLSRFKSRRDQEQIVQNLKHGTLDIVIGTHRLLSKDIGFKDLGLLIIDEEHRFGVRHKERLKSLRTTVDVLTLTATPIPRTLSLSMMGIRDMSLINTPPRDRLPIITEVLPFDEGMIGEAIHRELDRGGQVFFVHNRIQSIGAIAGLIQRIIPGIRLAVAHGQMAEHDLEKVMVDFVDQKYDCLVSTMIIESGLDLPNVNTLLVNRADRLGLAQLYQLRGRVGRSEKRAYAYLFTPPFQLLTPGAMKRLRTIEELTELGSGFQIALRDLEIRGFGNLLGVEQSGNMDAVGFDLYMRLIDEAIQELKIEQGGEHSQKQDVPVECHVDVDLNAFFQESYVMDENLRVNLYRRLSAIQSFSEIDDFSTELADRFGKPTKAAENLLNVVRLKLMGQSLGLKRILIEGQQLKGFYDEQWIETHYSLEQFIQELRKMTAKSLFSLKFMQKHGFGFQVTLPKNDKIEAAKKLLQSLG